MVENQVVENQGPRHVYDIVEGQEEAFKHIVTSDDVVWQKECQFAKQALMNNDFLNQVAWKNQGSLQNAIINLASIGITLNPASAHAYLVPRDGRVCLDISYLGLLHLAMQSGSILWGQAKLVYANDEYTNTGIDSAPIHKQKTFGDKGEIIGVYCIVKTHSGDYLTEEMDINDINKIRNTSKAKNGPWLVWPEQMMRKSVVKRAYKYWPKNDRLSKAVTVLNEAEGLDLESQEKEVKQRKLANEIEINEAAAKPFLDTITVIKEGIATGNLSSACEAWTELEEEEQMLLWNPPSKGGAFTTQERTIMQSSEFRSAYFGEK